MMISILNYAETLDPLGKINVRLLFAQFSYYNYSLKGHLGDRNNAVLLHGTFLSCCASSWHSHFSAPLCSAQPLVFLLQSAAFSLPFIGH